MQHVHGQTTLQVRTLNEGDGEKGSNRSKFVGDIDYSSWMMAWGEGEMKSGWLKTKQEGVRGQGREGSVKQVEKGRMCPRRDSLEEWWRTSQEDYREKVREIWGLVARVKMVCNKKRKAGMACEAWEENRRIRKKGVQRKGKRVEGWWGEWWEVNGGREG